MLLNQVILNRRNTLKTIENEVMGILKSCDAYWLHNGDSSKPHVELTSGLCSNGFINTLKALHELKHARRLADLIVHQIRAEIGEQQVDWVIGSPMAGITLAHDIGHAIGAKKSGFVEKDPSGDKGVFLWNRHTIGPEETVLQIEELITTSQTLMGVKETIERDNEHPINWIGAVGSVVHRPVSLPQQYDERKVIALIEREIWAVEQSKCELCAAGSERYRPKQHWDKLVS